MREIKDVVLTKEIYKFTSSKNVAKDNPCQIQTYRKLVEQVAKLSFLNKDYVLFFRGQNIDHRNIKSNKSTFYPTIYRADRLEQSELEYKFKKLEHASKILIDSLCKNKIVGYNEVKRKKIIQWALLQHYEVMDTPLIDVTQSLRVACSFAMLNNDTEKAFVYVFGLPYYTNRISINSEHDLINLRLLSISPPDALRPYFQEGFLVSTSDVTYDYEHKSELDLNRRLIAKFEIPNLKFFWEDDFQKIPDSALYPKNDIIKNICSEVKNKLETWEIEQSSKNNNELIGNFLKYWSEIEKGLIKISPIDNYNISSILMILKEKQKYDYKTLEEIDHIRRFRNKLVHNPSSVETDNIKNMMNKLISLNRKLNF